MKVLKNNIKGITLCLIEVLVGILLLINPVGFTSGIIVAAGVFLILVGLIFVIKYFKDDAQEAAIRQTLVKGLMALLTGVFCVLKSNWFVVTFPVLTIVYGIIILIAGLGKIQSTIDMIRQKKKKWFVSALSALISTVCAVIILNKPFASTAILWMFTGITLIIESVFDLIVLIVSGKNKESAEE